ncbi:MAG TPA: hypothetical protein VE961_08585 [Pyrinomonadaceae bacterium]|nr:hypothetical protein [Pyrinomonadaceae bacterium]
MTFVRPLIVGVTILFTALAAQAQGAAEHFAKEGLSFDYGSGWKLTDESTPDAQQLTLNYPNSDAQIRVFVHRGKADTPEKMAQAKKAFIDPYIKSVNDMFVSMGAKPEQSPANSQIAGAAAEGVRLRANLGGEAGEANIYWLALTNRVVILTIFGPDANLKQAAPTWDLVRNTIKIEAPPAKKP